MKKPSRIKSITAKKGWLVPPGVIAITLFGVAYCHSQERVDEINKTDDVDSQLESHETIHIRQAESTSDSWFVFYLKYIWQWICNLPLIFIDANAPYKFIPFELEAYRYQDDWEYCKHVHSKWEDYNKLTLKQKKKFAKMYYENKIYFTDFIKGYIDPFIQ